MGQISQKTGNIQMELDTMAGLERLGKTSDAMRYHRIFLLVNIEAYQACLEAAEKLLAEFTQLKLP